LLKRCYATEDLFLKRDIENLKIIIEYCNNVENALLCFGSDEEDFIEKIHFQQTCAFSIEQIGERVKRLSHELIQKHPEIDWRGIAGLRDVIAHNYGKIEVFELWKTVIKRVPELKTLCWNILSELERRG